MSQVQQGFIICTSCNRQFKSKPELAGKRVKCKCGNVIAIPAAPAAEAAEDDLLALAPEPAVVKPARATVMEQAAVEQDSYRCPSCQTPLSPGTALCTHCGFNFKTGQRMTDVPPRGTAVPSAVAGRAGAPPRYPGVTQRKDKTGEQEKQAAVKIGVAVVVLGVLVTGAIFGMRFLTGANEPAAPMLGDDAKVLRMIKDENGTEAREWLAAHPGRMIGGWTRSQAEFRIDEWYKLGAKKVYAFAGITTLAIALELPEDPQQRKALFEWENNWHKEMFIEPAKDVGQKYLLLTMRL